MYIITGGAGMIGSALLWELNNRGIDDVLIVDELGTDEKWKNLVGLRYLAYMHKDAFIEHLQDGSLMDALSYEYHPERTHTPLQGIVHMGACSTTTERDADYLMQNNLEFSKTICLWALSEGLRFINASSAATYGDGSNGFDDDVNRLSELRPLNMYGYSKHLFDIWAHRTGYMDAIASIKFFNVFGPNEYHKGDMRSLVEKAFHQVRDTGTIRLFKSYLPEYDDGGQMRDFIYVKDCAAVLADLLLEAPDVCGLFNLGTGTARNWNDLATAIFAAMDREPSIEYVDMPDILKGKYQYFTEAKMDRLKTALAGAGLAFQPTRLEDAVADYVREYLLKNERRL